MKLKISNSPTQSELDEIDLSLTTRRGAEYFIGRSPYCDLVLDSEDVSRQHGKFFSQSGNYYFCDLGSRNGTIINGKLADKNSSYILKNGDIIRIGDFALILEEDQSISEQSETVLRIINPSVFSNWNSQNANSNVVTPSPELVSQSQEVPESDVSESIGFEAPILEENNNDEEFIDTSEEVTFVQSGEATFVQSDEALAASADIVIPNNATELQENSEISNAISNESVDLNTPVEEANNINGVEPEYTIVQARNFQDDEDNTDSDVEQIAAQTQESNVHETISQADNFDSDVEDTDVEQIAAQTQESNAREAENEIVEVVSSNVDLYTSTTVEREEELISETASISTSEFVAEDLKVVSQETPKDAVENIDEKSFVNIAKILEDKQIVLISHETKKSELAELVAEHQEFLSYCLTRTWETFSNYLSREASLSVTQEIPPATSGGYQAINSLINSGEIIAVIFLRDFIVPQPGQASEEALLRTCNINEILLATNLLTAQAVIHYLKNMKDS